MAFELSLGLIAIIAAMILHLCATLLLIQILRPLRFLIKNSPYKFVISALMLTNVIFFSTHLVEVWLWASIYLYLHLATDFMNAYYSAFIMNTTLGLGMVPQEIGTRLLAPLTATSGIMTMGWTTSVFIYVLQYSLPHIARPD
ncbi:ion channel [Camelimonas sp. ID_303_24]